MKISDAVLSNLKELFFHQIRKTEYESVFWFKNLHNSEESLKFIIDNINDLNKIHSFIDDKLNNECDTLDIYLCLGENKNLELVIIYSPLEYYASDKVVGCYEINGSLDELVSKYKLTKIW